MQKEKSKEQMAKGSASVACPFCGFTETKRETDFGTTLAYAQFYCLTCRTPFEWIKWDDKISEKDLPTFLVNPSNT